ncbi:MAG: hypothetical protein ABIX01_03365 [Chitinophagaceae bacterium]
MNVEDVLKNGFEDMEEEFKSRLEVIEENYPELFREKAPLFAGRKHAKLIDHYLLESSTKGTAKITYIDAYILPDDIKDQVLLAFKQVYPQ